MCYVALAVRKTRDSGKVRLSDIKQHDGASTLRFRAAFCIEGILFFVKGLSDLHMRRVAVKAFGVWNRERVYFAYRLPSCVVIHSFMIIVFKGQHVSCGSARKLFCIVM